MLFSFFILVFYHRVGEKIITVSARQGCELPREILDLWFCCHLAQRLWRRSSCLSKTDIKHLLWSISQYNKFFCLGLQNSNKETENSSKNFLLPLTEIGAFLNVFVIKDRRNIIWLILFTFKKLSSAKVGKWPVADLDQFGFTTLRQRVSIFFYFHYLSLLSAVAKGIREKQRWSHFNRGPFWYMFSKRFLSRITYYSSSHVRK